MLKLSYENTSKCHTGCFNQTGVTKNVSFIFSFIIRFHSFWRFFKIHILMKGSSVNEWETNVNECTKCKHNIEKYLKSTGGCMLIFITRNTSVLSENMIFFQLFWFKNLDSRPYWYQSKCNIKSRYTTTISWWPILVYLSHLIYDASTSYKLTKNMKKLWKISWEIRLNTVRILLC